LILAANYLNIKNLLNITCKTVANMIEGKTTKELRETFNINRDCNILEEEQEEEWIEKEVEKSNILEEEQGKEWIEKEVEKSSVKKRKK